MKISTSLVMAGKFDGKPDETITPKFGRNWFYWLPKIKYNNGKFWKNEVTDIGLIWLFWVLDITIFGNTKKTYEHNYGLGVPNCEHKLTKTKDGVFQCEKCGQRRIKKNFN